MKSKTRPSRQGPPSIKVKSIPKRVLRFLTSAADVSQAPKDEVVEIAIMGRSNAGKSSFINALSSQKIAKVSQSPGKTRLLNFFSVGDVYRLVDMPGYGYASRGRDEIASWKAMIEAYLSVRENLRGLILIMDIRRDWQEEEEQLRTFAITADLPLMIVLNKADKVNKRESDKKMDQILKCAPGCVVFVTSAEKKIGVKAAEDYAYSEWVKESSAP